MLFLDKAKIFVASGSGGRGCVSFRREKNIEFGGPNGGDGGRGGDIIFKASKDLSTLLDFRFLQHHKAESGFPGSGRDQTGRSGQTLVIKVPVGTEIWDESDTLMADLVQDGQEVLLLSGGQGGRGNAFFKSSTNRAPKMASPGEPGQELWIHLRLKLLADIGIVGYPNAGKSTLLSVITHAHPKIGNYPFTTLHPELGVLRGHDRDYVLADLPGLIEGAHTGKGLGHEFLGHAERCGALLHMIDGTVPSIEEAYKTIRQEMLLYHPSFAEKKEIIVVNKIDLLDEQQQESHVISLKKIVACPIFLISAFTHKGLKELVSFLDGFLGGGL